MNNQPISERLRAYRKGLGLSQPQLALRWGMPLGTLRTWEQGRRQPTPSGPIKRLMELDKDAPQ